MKNFTTVEDVIRKLSKFRSDARIAIEDGEFGPLASTEEDDIEVRTGTAKDPRNDVDKKYECVIIGWK
jgi:hypothetical protein